MTEPTPQAPPTESADKPLVVAIDGPAGAGKSTIARAVAAALAVPFLDTGAMYRAVTWAMLDADLSVEDEAALGELAETIDLRINGEVVTVDGHDVSAAIRSEVVTENVSSVSAVKAVRDVLQQRQRQWAFAAGGGVMEGRDIGTVVFPDATVKIFLTASLEERARRRADENGGDLAELIADMAARDHADSTRDIAPLTRADDAVEVDSTEMTLDEVANAIVELARGA